MRKIITDLLPAKVELSYADYRDNFDGCEKQFQKAIQAQDWSHIDELINDEWLWEQEDNAIDYLLDELKDDLVRNFETTEERAENFIEDHKDELTEILRERDESTVFDDMLRHTEDPICFYDTGIELYESVNYDSDEFNQAIREVKKALKIKASEKKWDKDISLMIAQASYGGRLVIFFKGDIKELMSIEQNHYGIITFENPMVCVFDSYNGSGDNTDLQGHKFSLPLDTENIFLDLTIKYNYTDAICGMVHSWCDCTIVSFKKSKIKKEVQKSSLHNELSQEDKYIETFKAGSCTMGDMDMNRHRDTFYLNEFPCGTHCPHCHTFWID